MRPARCLKTLERRRDWLRERLDAGYGSPESLSYSADEVKALDWALPVLADLVERDRSQAVNVHRMAFLQGWQKTATWAMRRIGKRDPQQWTELVWMVGKSHPEVADRLVGDAEALAGKNWAAALHVGAREVDEGWWENVPDAAPVDDEWKTHRRAADRDGAS